MNERGKQLKTGLFVSGALVVLLVLLFYFGMSQIFVPKVRMYTTFSESVQGLNVGSEVKYRGVKIGTVRDISIHVEQKVVRVVMDIDPKRFSGITGSSRNSREEQFDAFIKLQMKLGLRCRLELSGITGMKYIDLDYYGKPGEVPKSPVASQDDGEYIPAVSSPFKDITGALTTVAEKLSRVDFEKISQNASSLLHTLNHSIDEKSLSGTLQDVQAAAADIRVVSKILAQTVNEKNIAALTGRVAVTLQSCDRLLRQLSVTVERMKLPETGESLRQSAASVQELRHEIANTLLYINSAAAELRRLCELLNASPDALLRGKKVKPLKEK